MKRWALVLSFLTISLITGPVSAQRAETTKTTTKVEIRMTDRGPTSELPFIPIARSPNLTDAQFSCMYFGQALLENDPQVLKAIEVMPQTTGLVARADTDPFR